MLIAGICGLVAFAVYGQVAQSRNLDAQVTALAAQNASLDAADLRSASARSPTRRRSRGSSRRRASSATSSRASTCTSSSRRAPVRPRSGGVSVPAAGIQTAANADAEPVAVGEAEPDADTDARSRSRFHHPHRLQRRTERPIRRERAATCGILCERRGAVEARRAHNPKVVGSNPTAAISFPSALLGGLAQVVEQPVHTRYVPGSNPGTATMPGSVRDAAAARARRRGRDACGVRSRPPPIVAASSHPGRPCSIACSGGPDFDGAARCARAARAAPRLAAQRRPRRPRAPRRIGERGGRRGGARRSSRAAVPVDPRRG